MAFPYIDTPRTEADGNATFLTNGGLRSALRPNLSVLDSAENSFQIPSKDEDIIRSIEKRRNGDMSTPRAGACISHILAASRRTVRGWGQIVSASFSFGDAHIFDGRW